MGVSQGVTHANATPIHKANTLNALPLAIIRWTQVIVIIILNQALKAPKSPTN